MKPGGVHDALSTSSEASMRKFGCELSTLSQPDGSACFCQGDTTILAAVYGPTEIRIAREQADRATVEVTFKRKSGLPGCVDKHQEKLLEAACRSQIMSSLHPRSAISIILQEMQAMGSVVACCINAACLALLDAAVPLRALFAAVSCVVLPDGQVILDPDNKQEREVQAHMTFVFESQGHSVISSRSVGTVTSAQYQTCLLACQEASQQIFQFFRQATERKLSRLV